MFKIENNIGNFIKRNERIIFAIEIAIVLIIIFTVILVNVIIKNNSNIETSLDSISEEELREEIVNNEDEYADIQVLEIVDEEEQNNEVSQNVQNTQSTQNTTNNQSKSYGTTYYIKVNYGAQVVTVYTKDKDGNYTKPVKAMVCSTGVYTPKSGVYKIPYRYRWLGLQGDVYGQYCTQIVGNILFHSVPYLRKGDPASIEYWEYDKLGTYASAGCIRLQVSDAMWIYNNCVKGTPVEFYSDSNPGPLGKPSAKKISNAEGELKNWDPTDPNPNNPWHNKNKENDKAQNVENNKENDKTQNDNNNQSNTNNNEEKDNNVGNTENSESTNNGQIESTDPKDEEEKPNNTPVQNEEKNNDESASTKPTNGLTTNTQNI